MNLRDHLLVIIGMKAAYMDKNCWIELPFGEQGEEKVAAVCTMIVDQYLKIKSLGWLDEPFDLFTERRLEYHFGHSKELMYHVRLPDMSEADMFENEMTV